MKKVFNIDEVRYSEKDVLSLQGRGVHQWDIRIKLILLFIVIVLNIGLAVKLLSAVLMLAGFILLIWSLPSKGRTILFFSAPLFATSIAFIGISTTFGKDVICSFGGLRIYREGLAHGAGMALRVYCDITWLALTFITTPFSDVIKAFRWFRVPDILTDTLSMMYRYSFALYDEFTRMLEAAASRGGAETRITLIRSVSHICAQIFIRAYDRSERIYMAMIARGAESNMNTADNDTSMVIYNSEEAVICRLTSVSFGYNKDKKALDDVSVLIRKGESVALCGRNGSGKTTLLKLCACLILPVSGKVEIMNKNVDKRTRRMLFKNVGFLFQDSDDQLFCPTVEEDIAFGPINMKLPSEEIEQRVKSAMEMMGITGLGRRPIHDLSGGEKKRVAIAGLLAMQTPILVMDEPTAGLDPASAEGLIDIIKELNRHHGYTILISTHDMDRVPEFAERLILLNSGRIYRDGKTRDVMNDLEALKLCSLEAPVIMRYFHGISSGSHDSAGLPLNLEEALIRNIKITK